MRASDMVRAYCLVKEARPRVVKIWSKLSPQARQRYVDFMPEDYARQLGRKPVAKPGEEGRVFSVVKGQTPMHESLMGDGNAVVKQFFHSPYTGRMSPPGPKMPKGHIPPNMGLGDLSVRGRYELMKELEHTGLFPKMYKPNARGYIMERLMENPPQGVLEYDNMPKAVLRRLLGRESRNPYVSLFDRFRRHTTPERSVDRIGISGVGGVNIPVARAFNRLAGGILGRFNTSKGPLFLSDAAAKRKLPFQSHHNVMRQIGPDGKPGGAVISDPIFNLPFVYKKGRRVPDTQAILDLGDWAHDRVIRQLGVL